MAWGLPWVYGRKQGGQPPTHFFQVTPKLLSFILSPDFGMCYDHASSS